MIRIVDTWDGEWFADRRDHKAVGGASMRIPGSMRLRSAFDHVEERIPRSEQVHVPVHGLGHARANLNEPVRPSRPVFNVEIPRSRGSNTSCGMGECDVWRMERQESLFNHDHRALRPEWPRCEEGDPSHRLRSRGQWDDLQGRGCARGAPGESPALVEALIQRMGWDADSMVTTSKGERTLAQALKTDVEIHRANKKFVQSLASKITRFLVSPSPWA